LAQLSHLQFYETPTATTFTVRGKVNIKPFDDPRVRKAMRLAVDCNKVLQLSVRGIGKVGEHHHIAPIHPEYAKLAPFPYEPAEAKRLLTEAGYPNGLDLELSLANDYGFIINGTQSIVEQWKAVGIRASIKMIPGSQYWEQWNKYPFGVTRWSHRALGTMVMSLAYRTGSPWNESEYSNPRLDE